MQSALEVSVPLATVFTGVIAGLFFAFSFSVMPALRKTRDETLVEVMQRINVAILNGWFALCFVGSLLASGSAFVLYTMLGGGEAYAQVMAGFVLYVAVIVVTRAFNIRLNNELARAGSPGAMVNAHGARKGFEAPWIRWNNVRMILSVASFANLVWATSIM